MKKLFALCFAVTLSYGVSAQTFTDTTGGSILEVNILNYYPVAVSGLPSVIDSTGFGVVQVCFNIKHTYDGDLDVMLQSPDGTIIKMSNNNGDNDNNFYNTCVQENATEGEHGEAFAPFNGDFYPDESVNHLNNGQDPNGTWHLVVVDEMPSDTGRVISFSITFGNNPPPTHEGGPCTTSNAIGCVCPDGSTECDLLPDMINSEKYIKDHWSEYPGKVTMGVATPNIGWAPLEVHSTGDCYCDTLMAPCDAACPDGSYPKEKVVQTIYHKSGATMSTYNISAGTMTYHPNHGHIHVDNWTYNTLRIRGVDPDARTWPIIAQSDKQSFCLINLGTCTGGNEYCVDDAGNIIDRLDLPNIALGGVSGCGNDQGIYIGKYDAYSEGIDGQEILFDDLCNGEYYLVSITDPNNNMKESNEDDNWVAVLLELEEQSSACCNGNFYADTTYGLAPFQVQFIDSTVPVAQSWIWDFGDGTSSTDQFPQHVYTDPGIYTVTLLVTTSTGCVDTIVHTEFITVDFGTSALPAPSPATIELKSYPNPFTSTTSVSFNLEVISHVHLYLTDVVGNTVKTFFDGVHHSGNSVYTIDAERDGLSNGVYFIHAEVAGKDYVAKLVKM